VYLHGVGDPGNVGTIVRTAHGLVEGSVVLGPDSADPYSPKAVRASMGSIFAQPVARAELGDTPAPRAALVAHGGYEPEATAAPITVCLGAEREGLPEDVVAETEHRWTIPLRAGGAESLNVAAAAAIVLGRISSARPEGAS
jgi:TrmH family RNA methyltransferase